MTSGQAAKEALVNALLDAASPATVLGVDWVTTTGLTLKMYGGNVLVGGVVTTLANQAALSLTNNSTNYVELDPTGTGTTSGIRLNTTGWTAGYIPLWSIVTSSGAITTWTDERAWGAVVNPRGAISMTSDANKTLTRAEAAADILDVTSTVSLTATRDIVVGLAPRMWVVKNGTTGGQSIQIIGASGTGVTIATAKTAIVFSDGTNVNRVTADA
jgi:hypothetical protein